MRPRILGLYAVRRGRERSNGEGTTTLTERDANAHGTIVRNNIGCGLVEPAH